MTITKVDEGWYKAEQKIPNGLLSYTVTAYASTKTKAMKKLIEREFKK